MSKLGSIGRTVADNFIGWKALRDLFCYVAAMVAVCAAVAYICHLRNVANYDQVTGRVISIELTVQPADPNEQGDYIIHLQSTDGKQRVASCYQSLCYKVRQGDTISADLDPRDNRLAKPLKITDRP